MVHCCREREFIIDSLALAAMNRAFFCIRMTLSHSVSTMISFICAHTYERNATQLKQLHIERFYSHNFMAQWIFSSFLQEATTPFAMLLHATKHLHIIPKVMILPPGHLKQHIPIRDFCAFNQIGAYRLHNKGIAQRDMVFSLHRNIKLRKCSSHLREFLQMRRCTMTESSIRLFPNGLLNAHFGGRKSNKTFDVSGQFF